jgi:hypothetical protein
MDKTRNDANPTQPIGPGAVYRADLNQPSIDTRPINPVPAVPVLDTTPASEPESAAAPDTLSIDRAGQVTRDTPAGEVLHLITKQIEPSTLQVPTKFNAQTMKHEPVVPAAKDESKPSIAHPGHRPLTGGV